MATYKNWAPAGWEGPADGVPCCYSTALNDWSACTCWEPVYDRDIELPDMSTEPSTRDRMCGDCAYRPGSQEKNDHPEALMNSEALEVLAESGVPFWCHDGLPRVTAIRHTGTGEVRPIPNAVDHYDPLIVGGVPYQSDGRAGVRCAGWDARRRALLAQEKQHI